MYKLVLLCTYMTQVIKASEARQQWSQLLNKVFRDQTRIIVEKSGIPVAAVISAEDLGRFIKLEEQREKDFTILDEIGEKFKNVPTQEIEQQVSKALTQVRVRNRKRDSASRNPL